MIQDYLFPELIIWNLEIINIHMVWIPMTLSESGLWKTCKNNVANACLVKCVKASLRDIGFSRGQNSMETQQGEYCLAIPPQFKINGT